MRGLSLIVAAALFTTTAAAQPASGPRVTQPIAAGRSARSITANRALAVRWPAHPRVSPDGEWLLFDVTRKGTEPEDNETHLFVTRVDRPAPRQLTRAGKRNRDAVWSPDSQRIAFVRTVKGRPQVFVLDLRGGEARQLTQLPGGATRPQWSPDGAQIAFAGRVYRRCKDAACDERAARDAAQRKVKARAYDELLYRHWNTWDDGTIPHVFVVDAQATRPPRDLTPGPHAVPPEHLNSGRGFAFAGPRRIVYCVNREARSALSTNHDLEVVGVDGSKRRRITTNPAWDARPTPSPDGHRIAYLAHRRPGFESDRAGLFIHDLRTGKTTHRSGGFDRRLGEIAWFPDGAGLYVTTYDAGHVELASVGAEAGEIAIQLANRTARSIDVAPDGSVVFVGSSFVEPPEIFRFDPKTREARRVTSLNEWFLRETRLGEIQEVTVRRDGSSVHGFLNLPPGFNPALKYPLVVLIHGGPQGAWTSGWSSRWNPQIFAGAGYVVAMPNPRGSIGYGQAFTDAVTRDWGGAPYQDVMRFTEAVASKRWVDGKKACAAGASYGGYMVNWIAGQTTRFSCLISHAGLFDLAAFWGDTEELWFPEWEFGAPPYQDRTLYDRWSPSRHVKSMKTPTMVIHGQLDYRVDLSHGLSMFTALRRRGVPSRLVYFPDEGHWITDPNNFVYWFSEMHGWLRRHLKGQR